MTQKHINNGTAPNDKTGDTLFTAFGKVNDNFTEVYDAISSIQLGTGFATESFVTSQGYITAADVPPIPSDVNQLTDNSHLLGGGTPLPSTSGQTVFSALVIGGSGFPEWGVTNHFSANGSTIYMTGTKADLAFQEGGTGYGEILANTNTFGLFRQGSITINPSTQALVDAKTTTFETNGNITLSAGADILDSHGVSIIPTFTSQLTNDSGFIQVSSVPQHSYGAPGDVAGMIAVDADHIYSCVQNYVSNTISLIVNDTILPQGAYYGVEQTLGTKVSYTGPLSGLQVGETFTYNAVIYTVQEISNTPDIYATITFSPHMDAPTMATITPGTEFLISTGNALPDIWRRVSFNIGTW